MLILFNQLVMLIMWLCVAVVVLHHKLVEQVISMGFFFWSSQFYWGSLNSIIKHVETLSQMINFSVKQNYEILINIKQLSLGCLII